MEDNQVEVEILTQTITAQYGTLAQGDKLRTSKDFAKHLVEDAKAAKYTSARKAESDDASTDQNDGGTTNTAQPPAPAPSPAPSPAPTRAPAPTPAPARSTGGASTTKR